MFARVKESGKYQYLQLVRDKREGRKIKQRVMITLGRLEELQSKGEIESLIRSLSRFSEETLLILTGKSDIKAGAIKSTSLIFERLWKQTGIGEVIKGLLKNRRYKFSVERAIFITVLHRLMVSGFFNNMQEMAKRLQNKRS